MTNTWISSRKRLVCTKWLFIKASGILQFSRNLSGLGLEAGFADTSSQ